VTTSEFGRTVREDGNNGTDHRPPQRDHGAWRQGARQKVYGRWPGSEPEQLSRNGILR
jgi:uncharacterized protein (DUF1501 family)